MFIFASPRTLALAASLALHILLVVFVVLNKLSDNALSLFSEHKDARVVMLPPQHRAQTIPQTASQQPLPRTPQQVSKIQEQSQPLNEERVTLLAPPVFSEEEQETRPDKQRPAPLGTEKGTSKTASQKAQPHSFSHGRSSWSAQEEELPMAAQTEPTVRQQDATLGNTRQTAYTEQNGIATSFGSALAYHPDLAALAAEAGNSSKGTERGLTTVVNQEFSVVKTRQYLKFITYSIGYELNKQNIHEAPCDLPRRLVVEIHLASSGKLLNTRILSSDGMPDFNQAVLQAITAASPFRSFPASFKEKQVSFTFTITPDPSVLAQPNSTMRIPISFFVSNPYQS